MKKTVAFSLIVLCLFLSACSAPPSGGTTSSVVSKPVQADPTTLYVQAVQDSKQADVDEVMPLVELTPDDHMVTMNEKGQVLLLSWHKYPESYPAGSSFVCQYGAVWTFTDGEVCAWYDVCGQGVTDWNLRLEQLIGLPKDSGYTHVTAFWADLDEVIRPAYQPDPTLQITEEVLDGSALGEQKDWFHANAETEYPWTRLGYTYDWEQDPNEYGLTEFLILADSQVEVEWTKSTEEFVAWIAAN